MIPYNEEMSERDVIISSGAFLIRNLEDYPFTKKLDAASCDEIREKVFAILSKEGFVFFEISKLSKNEAGELCERGYLSENAKYLFLCEEKGISVSVCGKNHIEIRAFLRGLSISDAFSNASEIDRLLDSSLLYAYDKRLGYLSESPFDLGCGARFFARIFIPALYESMLPHEIETLFTGFEMCDSFGGGYYYDIKTGSSLGHSEEELISRLSHALIKLTSLEREKRGELYMFDKDIIFDRIMRSLGIGKYAKLMSLDDMIKICSDLRLGIILGLDGYTTDYNTLDTVMYSSLPFAVKTEAGKEKSAEAARAEIVSKALSCI